MHLLFQLEQLSQSFFRPMRLFFEKRHHLAEYLEIVPFRREFELILLEERDYYRLQIFPPEDLIPITMLMVRAIVFLEINTSASEEILETIENIFVALDEFYVEFWFYDHSSCDILLDVWIPDIDGEASFSIDKSDHVVGTEFLL